MENAFYMVWSGFILTNLASFGIGYIAGKARSRKQRGIIQNVKGMRDPGDGLVPFGPPGTFTDGAKLYRKDIRAITGLEYGIIAGVLGVVLVLTIHGFGEHLTKLFSIIGKSI